jgi:prepilin-type N-terminal cleavage/methylation domain-containing protein
VKSLRSEHGYTLVEIMIAMALMSVGVAATLRVFGSSGRTAQAAQRDNVATQKAQAAVDLLGTTPYNKLGLTSTPASSSDPVNPGYRVNGSTLAVKSGLTETFVLPSDPGQAGAAVSPAAEAFTVGSGTSAITGHIYRYVTWRDENCPTGICDGSRNTKRVTVAVTISGNGAVPAGTPVWVSKVVPDPQALPPGATGTTGPTGSTVSAQDFYLYDTRCGNTTRQATTGDHDTHNTAQNGGDPSTRSSCENSNSALQPDLMGVDLPGDPTSPPPLYKLSSDLSGNYDGGLAMTRKGTSCPTTYTEGEATNQSTTNQWSIHAWATNTFASTFSLAGQVTLSLFTSTVGGVPGAGAICATLVDRSIPGGVPVDVNLGSFTYTLGSWPTSVRRISFTLNVSPASIPAGHRLILTLGVKSASDNDLYFVYDHPFYPSFLEVATPTPL